MREKFFQIYNISWEKWAEKHGIEPVAHECRGCGQKQITDLPIASLEFRGLAVRDCGCGHKAQSLPFSFVKAKAFGELATYLGKAKISILEESPKSQDATVLKLKPSGNIYC